MLPMLARSQTAVVMRRPVSQLREDEVDLLREAYTRLEGEGESAWRLQALRDLHKEHCSGNGSNNVHLSWHFLPWHRALIYLHERVLRELLGRPNFRLPYWDWENGVPSCYELPEDESNPLWRKGRYEGFSSKMKEKFSACTAWREFLEPQEFAKGDGGLGGNESQEGKASRSDLHQFAHGISWTMFLSSTAAYDPLFYIHHAAVDRAWVLWERDKPSDPNRYPDDWCFREHHFPPIGSQHVVFNNEQLLDIHGLGYDYSSEVCVGFEPGGQKISFDPEVSGEASVVPLSSDTLVRLKSIEDGNAHVYFWITGFFAAASTERLYTLWLTPRGKRAPSLRLGVQGTFGSAEGLSGYTLNIPFFITPIDLLRISNASDTPDVPGFQICYAPGEIESNAVPANAVFASFESVSAVIRTSRVLAEV